MLSAALTDVCGHLCATWLVFPPRSWIKCSVKTLIFHGPAVPSTWSHPFSAAFPFASVYPAVSSARALFLPTLSPRVVLLPCTPTLLKQRSCCFAHPCARTRSRCRRYWPFPPLRSARRWRAKVAAKGRVRAALVEHMKAEQWPRLRRSLSRETQSAQRSPSPRDPLRAVAEASDRQDVERGRSHPIMLCAVIKTIWCFRRTQPPPRLLHLEITVWLPGRSGAALGSIPTFPPKLLFCLCILPAVSRLDAGGWRFFPGRVSASACISLSLLMESLLKISHFISQMMPGSSIRHFVLIDLTSVSVQVTSGLGEEPELPSDRAGPGQSPAWYLHQLRCLVDVLLNVRLCERDGRSVSGACSGFTKTEADG